MLHFAVQILDLHRCTVFALRQLRLGLTQLLPQFMNRAFLGLDVLLELDHIQVLLSWLGAKRVVVAVLKRREQALRVELVLEGLL